jgi:hypothetical protein
MLVGKHVGYRRPSRSAIRSRGRGQHLRVASVTQSRRPFGAVAVACFATVAGLSACASTPPTAEPAELLLLRDYLGEVHDDALKITDGPGSEAGAVMRLGPKYRTADGCDVGSLTLTLPGTLAPRTGDRNLDSCVATGFFLGVYHQMNCELTARVDEPGTDRSALFITAWCRGRVA